MVSFTLKPLSAFRGWCLWKHSNEAGMRVIQCGPLVIEILESIEDDMAKRLKGDLAKLKSDLARWRRNLAFAKGKIARLKRAIEYRETKEMLDTVEAALKRAPTNRLVDISVFNLENL